MYKRIVNIFLVIIYLCLTGHANPQIMSKDTSKIPEFGRNKIKDAYRLDTQSDTVSYAKYIWNDKRTVSEILNERPGYFITDFGTGSRNLIFFNGIYDNRLGFCKDGIQVNDMYFGGLETENFSVNEIDRIEEVSTLSSFIYGLNSTGKVVNIISKDFYRSKTFSQLRYSQDRYNSLNADVNFTVPLSDKFTVNSGVNNNNIEGRYQNSEYSFWRGRTKLSYFVSPELNVKFNFNYAQIQRGLNYGLINSTIDTLSDPILAQIVNPNAYEKIRNYFYDIDICARLFGSEKSLTKFKIYSINSVRKYRDDQSGPQPDPLKGFHKYDFRYIQYGLDLKQNIFFPLNSSYSVNLLAGYNAYINLFDNSFSGKSDNNYHSLISKLDFLTNNLALSVFGRYNKIDNDYFNYGIETKYKIFNNVKFTSGISFGVNKTAVPVSLIPDNSGEINNRYFEICYFARFENLFFNVKYFNNQKKINGTSSFDGFNVSSDFVSGNFDYYFSADKFNSVYFPAYSIKTDISYHNYFFKNKLNLRLGLNLKYANNLETMTYNQIFYLPAPPSGVKVNYFNLDFYIGARIGKANINFTIGNIFNTFNYLSYLYALPDRGGALQFVSRFTIVWDFLN